VERHPGRQDGTGDDRRHHAHGWGDVLPGRRVDAIQVGTSQSYSAVTNVTGGFSIPVPPGKYRLEPELREGEKVVRDPGIVNINKSDLDANLEIVVGS